MRHCEVCPCSILFFGFLELQTSHCKILTVSLWKVVTVVCSTGWFYRKWSVRMGHYHHGFRVVEIVVRFLSATHGARRSDIQNKATTTESRWESWAMRMWLRCHWWCWLAPGMAENFYGRAGIESGNIASNLISVNQHTTVVIFLPR